MDMIKSQPGYTIRVGMLIGYFDKNAEEDCVGVITGFNRGPQGAHVTSLVKWNQDTCQYDEVDLTELFAHSIRPIFGQPFYADISVFSKTLNRRGYPRGMFVDVSGYWNLILECENREFLLHRLDDEELSTTQATRSLEPGSLVELHDGTVAAIEHTELFEVHLNGNTPVYKVHTRQYADGEPTDVRWVITEDEIHRVLGYKIGDILCSKRSNPDFGRGTYAVIDHTRHDGTVCLITEAGYDYANFDEIVEEYGVGNLRRNTLCHIRHDNKFIGAMLYDTTEDDMGCMNMMFLTETGDIVCSDPARAEILTNRFRAWELTHDNNGNYFFVTTSTTDGGGSNNVWAYPLETLFRPAVPPQKIKSDRLGSRAHPTMRRNALVSKLNPTSWKVWPADNAVMPFKLEVPRNILHNPFAKVTSVDGYTYTGYMADMHIQDNRCGYAIILSNSLSETTIENKDHTLLDSHLIGKQTVRTNRHNAGRIIGLNPTTGVVHVKRPSGRVEQHYANTLEPLEFTDGDIVELENGANGIVDGMAISGATSGEIRVNVRIFDGFGMSSSNVEIPITKISKRLLANRKSTLVIFRKDDKNYIGRLQGVTPTGEWIINNPNAVTAGNHNFVLATTEEIVGRPPMVYGMARFQNDSGIITNFKNSGAFGFCSTDNPHNPKTGNVASPGFCTWVSEYLIGDVLHNDQNRMMVVSNMKGNGDIIMRDFNNLDETLEIRSFEGWHPVSSLHSALTDAALETYKQETDFQDGDVLWVSTDNYMKIERVDQDTDSFVPWLSNAVEDTPYPSLSELRRQARKANKSFAVISTETNPTARYGYNQTNGRYYDYSQSVYLEKPVHKHPPRPQHHRETNLVIPPSARNKHFMSGTWLRIRKVPRTIMTASEQKMYNDLLAACEGNPYLQGENLRCDYMSCNEDTNTVHVTNISHMDRGIVTLPYWMVDDLRPGVFATIMTSNTPDRSQLKHLHNRRCIITDIYRNEHGIEMAIAGLLNIDEHSNDVIEMFHHIPTAFVASQWNVGAYRSTRTLMNKHLMINPLKAKVPDAVLDMLLEGYSFVCKSPESNIPNYVYLTGTKHSETKVVLVPKDAVLVQTHPRVVIVNHDAKTTSEPMSAIEAMQMTAYIAKSYPKNVANKVELKWA